MNTSKIVVTITGAALAVAGLGGVPIYVLERDLLRLGLFTFMLIAGIIVLGYAAKE